MLQRQGAISGPVCNPRGHCPHEKPHSGTRLLSVVFFKVAKIRGLHLSGCLSLPRPGWAFAGAAWLNDAEGHEGWGREPHICHSDTDPDEAPGTFPDSPWVEEVGCLSSGVDL